MRSPPDPSHAIPLLDGLQIEQARLRALTGRQLVIELRRTTRHPSGPLRSTDAQNVLAEVTRRLISHDDC